MSSMATSTTTQCRPTLMHCMCSGTIHRPLAAHAAASQPRGSDDVARMTQLVDDWLPRPIIPHPWPSERFAVTHPRWEPYSGKPLVRFCRGGAMKRASLPRPISTRHRLSSSSLTTVVHAIAFGPGKRVRTFISVQQAALEAWTATRDLGFHTVSRQSPLTLDGRDRSASSASLIHISAIETNTARTRSSLTVSARLRQCAACCRYSLGVTRRPMVAPAQDGTMRGCGGSLRGVKGPSSYAGNWVMTE